MKKQISISVLIPTMNRPDTLSMTLKSYFNAKYIPKQIVVVDQTQDENIAKQNEALIQSYYGICNCKYIYQDEPCLTKARNRAMQFAEEDIVVCSDDDVDVFDNTLFDIYNRMSQKEIAMMAVLTNESVRKYPVIGYILGNRSFRKRKMGHVALSMFGRYPQMDSEEVETEWAMGYFFAIKKHLVEKWNLFWDENLNGYCYAEDLDFSYSYYKCAKAENMKCIIDSKIRVNHRHSTEYRTPSKKNTYMYLLNRYYLWNKHKMGLMSYLDIKWCNLWLFINRVLHHDKPLDFIEAEKYYITHKKEVLDGNLFVKGVY